MYLAGVFFCEKDAASIPFSTNRTVTEIIWVFQETRKSLSLDLFLFSKADVWWATFAANPTLSAAETRVRKYYI